AIILLVITLNQVSSQRFGGSSINSANRFTYKNRHREVLDPKTGYAVEWNGWDRNSKAMVFNISTRAVGNGYVAFGLSKNGQLDGADVVICGIGSDGKPYIFDTTGSGRNRLNLDSTQNWKVLSAQRNQGRLQMTISRNLDTCDGRNPMINDNLMHLIWGQGQGNGTSFNSQFVPEGNKPIYLQDPESTPNTSGMQNWRISRSFRVPPRHTSYWCSIVKGPSLSRKHHISSFGAYLPNELARRHVHHQLVYRCIAPEGMDSATLFEQFTNHPGEECYLNDNHVLPTVFCREMIHMWAVGGRPSQLPDEVGIPIGLTQNEYYLFESHYDNPDVRSDLVIESGVDFQYSPQIRRDEGMIIFNGYSVFGGFAVPPQSSDFPIAGHCSPDCSRSMLSEVGSVDIFGVTLHAHVSSRRLRVHHFRGNRELPWVINDDNYDFNYQQLRFLPNPVTIQPGDQLTTRCSYDTTWKNGSTVSGFSTRDEMCMSFLFINKRIPYLYCTSEYPTQQLMTMFGIRNITWELNAHERIVTNSDFPQLVGLPFSEVVNRVNWSPQRRTDLEREQFYGTHAAACPNLNLLSQMAAQAIVAQRASGQASGANPSNALSGLNTISTPGATSTASYPTQVGPYQPPSCQRSRSPWEIRSSQKNQAGLLRGNIGRYPFVPAPISSGGFLNRPKLRFTRVGY
ncbi:DBH-like monooxygenase protein 1, partial [Orchesella cincta]